MHRSRTDGSCSGGGVVGSSSTARLTAIIIGYKLSEGNVSRTASRAGTCRRKNPEVARARAAMSPSLGFQPLRMLRSEVSLDGLAMAVAMRGPGVTILPSRLEQNTPSLGSIGWWGG